MLRFCYLLNICSTPSSEPPGSRTQTRIPALDPGTDFCNQGSADLAWRQQFYLTYV
jgi:hypothetical protein